MARVFISYKTGAVNNPTAGLLDDFLKSKGHQVFLDRRDLIGGLPWDDSIFAEISACDVLIVLITGDILVSETKVGALAAPWVQREVDFARGCRVQILPVVLRTADLQKDPATKRDVVTVVMEALALVGVQYVQALDTDDRPERRFVDVESALQLLSARTRNEQKQFSASLVEKWAGQDKADPMQNPPAQPAPRYASFALIKPDLHPHACKIHLAAGDITSMSSARQPIHVLVNSENVYMQMQRVVDRDSVSKKIRLSGAKGRGNYMEQDTIQSELFDQVFPPRGRGVPVEIGDVFVTDVGQVESDLSRRGIKCIFHVAAVDADTKAGQKPLSDESQVVTCVKNCLVRLDELNATDAYRQSPLSSIIFPLIGTGQGGLPIEQAARAIVQCATEYLLDTPDTGLENLYVTAYTMGNVKVVDQIMGTTLRRL
jgi:O-acetyl-ADP-ribose deacetylase (regulator of RNase III)